MLVIIFSLLLSQKSLASEPTIGQRCFSMLPLHDVGERCVPQQVRVQMQNCATNENIGEPMVVTARYECKGADRKLKYWYKDSMLISDLEPGLHGYGISNSYSIYYGTVAQNKRLEKLRTPSSIVSLPAPVPEEENTLDGWRLPSSDAANAGKPAVMPSPVPPPVSPPAPSPTPVATPVVIPAATPVVTPVVAPVATPVPMTTTVAPVAAPAPQAEPAKKESCEVCDALKGVKVSGSIDGYIAYNFNSPPVNSNPSNYGSSPASQNTYLLPNAYHDQFSIALARLSFEHVASEENSVGFRIDLGFGPLADFYAGSDNNLQAHSDDATRYFLQAYLSYRPTSWLLFNGGKMQSLFGSENIDPVYNMNYSLSLGYIYVIPHWGTGLNAVVDLGDGWSITGEIINGVDEFYDNNVNKTYLGQLRKVISDAVDLRLNLEAGYEGAGGIDDRSTYEFVGIFKFSDSLKVITDWSLALDNMNDGGDIQADSFIFSFDWGLTQKFHLLPRYEIFNDSGVSFGTNLPQVINSAVLGVEYRPNPHLRFQLEYRYDSSTQLPYIEADGTQLGTQGVATLSAMASF